MTPFTWGSYFESVRDDLDFPIYGYILTREELEKTEDEETMPGIIDRYERGHMFCRCYSVACTDGEFGFTHVNMMTRKLTQEDFEAIRARGFVPVTRPGAN